MNWLKLIITYLPVVLSTVSAVETISKDHAVTGSSKKQMVLDIITTVGTSISAVPEEHIAGIGQLIDSTVETFNKSGIFSKSK